MQFPGWDYSRFPSARAVGSMDINYRERVVVDQQMIADALLRFESVVKSLPTDDQKGLLQIIIREMSVKPFDPKTDRAPREKGAFSMKIRTKWHLVNISLYASDLNSGICTNGETSSDLKRIGSRGRARTKLELIRVNMSGFMG
jgi:hypothetical protein